MSATYTIVTDAATRALTPALLTAYQAQIDGADLAYLYAAAARVGLSKFGRVWRSDSERYTLADFTPHAGTSAASRSLTIEDSDAARVTHLVTLTGAAAPDIAGAAACTGMLLLSGTFTRIVGPFSL